MRRLLAALALLPLCQVPTYAQVSFGLSNAAPAVLCVYDRSATRPCVAIGTVDSTAHTFASTPQMLAVAGASVLTGAVSGAGITALFASPPSTGGVVPNTGAFTTLSASGTVSGAGFTALFASPPPTGDVVPNSGAFTTLGATGNTTVGGTLGVTGAATAAAFSTVGALSVTGASSSALFSLDGTASAFTADTSPWVFQNSSITAQSIYTSVSPFIYSDIVRSVLSFPSGSTITGNANAFGAYIQQDGTANTVQFFGVTKQNVAASKSWGLNPTVAMLGANQQHVGAEWDITLGASATGAVIQGISIIPQFTAGATWSASNISCSPTPSGQNFWDLCFTVGAGASRNGTYPNVGLYLGQTATSGTSLASQKIRYASVDSGGTGRSWDTFVNTSGRYMIQASSATSGFYITSNAPIQYSTWTVASLAAAYPCNATNVGVIAMVIDALAPTYNAVVAAGGGSNVQVHCDGVNYRTP